MPQAAERTRETTLNLRIDAADTGSLPLRTALTLDKSSGTSPSLGPPRAAACSKAKFGATETTPPVSSGFADISRIQRSGRRTNAAGVMNTT